MRVDVHAHYHPPALYDLLDRLTGVPRRRLIGPLPGFSTHVSVDGQLELMDGAGIDRMVVSHGQMAPYYPSPETAVAAARGTNDAYAELTGRYPGRFNAFLGLPLPHVDAAVEELDRALAWPGMVGVALGCSVLGEPLDRPAFEPVFAELDHRRAVVFLHPVGTGAPNTQDYSLTWMLGSRFEDSVAMGRLILSGLTLRYPNIRFIVPHLGGTMALFLQRMDNVAERDGWRETRSAELMPSDLARRFWFDTVNEQHSALRCACETFGVERILLGTDWPMLPPEKLKHFVDYIPEALPPDDARRILEVNAAELLGLSTSA
jgi:aminocarboxymuconate-semialdehyde decarboxylase